MITVIMTELFHPGVVMMATIGVLISSNVIDANQGFQGFSDRTFITLIVSYVLSNAIIKNRSLEFVTRNILPEKYQKNVWPSLLIMVLFVAILSVFVDNTPVVTIGISIILTWKKTSGIKVSKVLLPISFAAILGGMNSLIGNSSFIKANHLLQQKVLEMKNKGYEVDAKLTSLEIFTISIILIICSDTA